jgi:hypothetical protein
MVRDVDGHRANDSIRATFAALATSAIETAALMLGTDKSRGYCLEMICADFLAGANLDGGDPELLLQSQRRFFRFLAREQQAMFIAEVTNHHELPR